MRVAGVTALVALGLLVLVPTVAQAAEPPTAEHTQLMLGLALGAGERNDWWGLGVGAHGGYTFRAPLYLGVAIDGFFHESKSFGEYMGEFGYDFGVRERSPGFVLRPKVGVGGAHVLTGSANGGLLIAPGAEAILSVGVLLSAEARYDLVFVGAGHEQAVVFELAFGASL